MGVHGDEVRTTKDGPKITVISWNFILADKKLYGWDSRVLVSVLECDRHTDETLSALFKVLSWSFQCLAAGTYPTCDHQGIAFKPKTARSRLAGQKLGGHAYLVELRGDWQWHQRSLELTRHWASDQICYECNARRSNFVSLACRGVWETLSYQEFLANCVHQHGLERICN